jgi:hypothetical protein
MILIVDCQIFDLANQLKQELKRASWGFGSLSYQIKCRWIMSCIEGWPNFLTEGVDCLHTQVNALINDICPNLGTFMMASKVTQIVMRRRAAGHGR